MPRFLRLPAFVVAVLASTTLSSYSTSAQAPTTTAVTAAASGTAVTIGATVTPTGTPVKASSGSLVFPTGTVQFFDGTAALTSTPQALSSPSGFATTPFATYFGTLDPSVAQSVVAPLAGDLNGDGVQDLLVYQSVLGTGSVTGVASLAVQSFLSQSGGAYSAAGAQSLSIPASLGSAVPIAVPVLADLNGDGKLDLLYGSSVAYGIGDGTFQQPVVLSFLATGFTSTYAADVTGDGKSDIIALDAVALNPNDATPITLAVTVFKNEGSGNFQNTGTFPISPPESYIEQAHLASLGFVDLNGDGELDLVAQMYFLPAGNAAEPATITSVLNHGDGTFAAPVTATYAAQQNQGDIEIESLQTGDFNGDGKLDLALIYPTVQVPGTGYQTSIIFLPGKGDGTLEAEIDSTFAPSSSQLPAQNVVTADVNLDGNLDLLFGSGAVVNGDGKGGFSPATAVTPAPPANLDPQLTLLPRSSLPTFVFMTPASTPPSAFPLVATYNDSTASLAPMALAAGTHSITASYSGDSHYAASTSSPAVLTVAPLYTTTMVVTSSANPAYQGETVTISIAVTSSGPVPTGTIALSYVLGPMSGLQDGPATLTLDANGNASFQIMSQGVGYLPGGEGITLNYSGDANHAPASASLTQLFDASASVTPSTGTITVKSGQSASTQLSLSGAAGVTGSLSLSCNGLPVDASCSFNPGTVNLTGGVAQTVTLTVSTRGSSSASVNPLFGRSLQTLAGGIFAGSLFLLLPRSRWTHWIGLVILSLGLIPLGCGGGSSSSSSYTPPGTYTFDIVAGSSAVPNAMYELVVQ